MHQKLLLLILAILLFGFSAFAQVAPPCPSNTFPGAESCQNACVYCNFDGYTGTNNGTPSGGTANGCPITLHNDQWFGFVAGTESITIDILTSNCQTGNGLQAAFYADCNDPALDCNAGTAGGGGIPLTLSYSSFVPGQTYFLMLDGYSGEVCDFEIDVVDGSVTPPAPTQPPAPQGPTVVCPGAVVEYTIPDVPGAGYYRWTAPAGSHINGGSNNVQFPAPDGTTVTITFGSTGGQVCVQAGNACFAPLQSCIPIVNQPIPPTVLPQITVCFEDLPYVWDEEPHTPVSLPGTFNLTSSPYDSYLGCDSVIKQTIVVKNQITKNIGLKYVCPGTCFTINGNNYCQPGSYQEKFDSYQDCDSIVQFTVLSVPIVADIAPVTSTISCTNPALTLSNGNSTSGPNTTFTWTNAAWAAIGSAPTQTVNTGGVFNLIVSNTSGGVTCMDTASVTVPQNISLPNISAQGDTLTCLPNGTAVTLQGNSTTPGVNYSWSGPGITAANQNQQNPTTSTAGTYILTISNPANNCTATATVEVVANNTVPTATATGGVILCTQPSITIDGNTNAISPSYAWAGPGINAANSAQQDPVVTVAGNYTVTITNTSNGCTNTATATVDNNTIVPVMSAGNDLVINCLQPNVTLQGNGSPVNVNFHWTGPGITAANQNLPTPNVTQPGTYILTATDPVNGCAKSDTALVDASLIPPVVNAGADQTLTCTITSVALGGSGTSQGTNFQLVWAGPDITPGNINQLNPVVGAQGNYTLTITNTINGCTATDAVLVGINTQIPSADAGSDQTLTCTTLNGVTLAGNGTPANVSYLWTGPGIGINNETLAMPQVSQPGNYTLLVTNPLNGCTQTDNVVVLQDANVPTASAGPDLNLNCTINSVDLVGTGSSTGPNIIYQWTGPGITPLNTSQLSPSGIALPGNYNLTVIDTSNHCENSDIVVVSIDTLLPAADAGQDLVLNCYNNGADTLDAAASSTGPNFTFSWTGPGITPANQTATAPVVAAPGIYTLTITNVKNNCTATDVVSVADDQATPVADAGTDKTINCVSTSTAIGGNSSTGSGFTYKWAGPGIVPAIQDLAQPTVGSAGSYLLTVTNSGNGCTSTDNVTVILDAVYPTALAGPDLVLTCAQANQVLDGSLSSSGPDFAVQWSGPGINPGNQNSLNPMIAAPGSYILSIANTTNSCVTQDTVDVLEDKTPPTVHAGLDLNLDCQTTTVTLDGSGSASGTGIVYLWTGNGITPGTANLQSPSTKQPGLYTLLVTDSNNGCTDFDDVVVTQDTVLPLANAGPDFTLTCTLTSKAIDGSASSAGAGMDYLWQGPGINTSNYNLQNPVVTDSGTYLLTVTNLQNHCTATDVAKIGMDADLPVANAGPDQTLTCTLDTAQLNGGNSQAGAGITYSWGGPGIVSGGQGSITPQVFLPGIYTLTVANANNGCTNTDAVSVGQDIIPPIADAGSSQLLTCATSSGVTISASASDTGPGFALQWNGPGINASNQNLISPVVNAPGMYIVVVTNLNNGCTSTSGVTVGQDQNLPLADAGLDQTITCAVTQVTLDAGGSTGNGPLDFSWSGPGINTGNQNQFNPNVTQAGQYSVTVTNSLTGCKATDIVEVLLDNAPPQATATGSIITCTALTVTISATSSLSGSSFSWSGPDINLGNMNLQNPQVGDPGAYVVTVTAPNGCSASATATVGIDASVPVGNAEGTQLNCLNNGQSTVSATIITQGVTFSWSGPGGFTSTQLTPTVTVPGIYVLTLQSPNGCAKPYEATVTADFAQPMVKLFVNDELDCSTTSVTINGSGSSVGTAFIYSWSTSGGNIVSGGNTLNPVVDLAGQYTLLITNNLNGCTNTGAAEVKYNPSVPTGFDLAVSDIRCYGELNGSIGVNGVNGGTQPFQFSLNGSAFSGTGQFSQLGEGSYTLELIDAKGCKLDTTVLVTAPGALQIDLDDDVLVELGETVTVTATLSGTTPIASVSWNPPAPCTAPCFIYDTLPTHSYLQTITVRDSNGCVSTDRQLIQVDRSRRIFVPNVFNFSSSDPLNAFLMVQGGNDVRNIKTWQIFDRWGNAIFVRNNFLPNDPGNAWDGKIRGDVAAQAVYVWYIEVEFVDGETERFEGDVTLVKQ